MSVRIGDNPKIADTAQNSFSLILFTLIEYCIVVNKRGLVWSNFCVYKGNQIKSVGSGLKQNDLFDEPKFHYIRDSLKLAG